jgi:hypothetical protein
MRSAAPYSWSISGIASRSKRAARSSAVSAGAPAGCAPSMRSSTAFVSAALLSAAVSAARAASAVCSVPGTALLSRRVARTATSGTATPVATA